MQGIVILGLLLIFQGVGHASHLTAVNADNITTGQLDSARLDPSSVTLRGNKWDDDLDASTTNLRNVILTSTSSISSVKRDYDLYIGTPGTQGNVDVIANETNSFNSAFASAPINARGLTINTSAQATIFVSPGIYDVCGATIPKGVEVWATPGSSTVFRPTSDVCRMFTVYGALRNITFDMQGRPRAGQMVSIATGGAVTGFTVENADNGDQSTANQYTSFMVEYATNVRIDGKFNSYAGTSQDNYRGGLVSVWHSTNVYINLDVKDGRYDTNGKQSIFTAGSRNVIVDGNYRLMGGRFIFVYGGSKDIFIRGNHHITKPYNGYIYLKPAEFGAISTGTFVSVHLLHDVADTNVLMELHDGGVTLPLNGVVVNNCTVTTTQSTVPTAFANVRVGTTRAIFMNNVVHRMNFISDSGSNTQYQSLGNFVNGIEQ